MEQNAGVLVRVQSNEAVFEPFELSPTNEAVMTTKGRLVRGFPASATAIPTHTLNDAGFRATITQTLAQMSRQPAPGIQPQARKSGQDLNEDRDTTHPNMVCAFLVGFLKANGKSTKAAAITKHTREEVLWSNACYPWQRLAMWLLIRVALQLHFNQIPGGDELYKHFMLFFLSFVSEQVCDKIYVMNAKIVRRLQKLSRATATVVLPSLHGHLEDILQLSANRLSARWKKAQEDDTRKIDLAPLASLDFVRGSLVYLPELDKYLQSLQTRSTAYRGSGFAPNSMLIYDDYAVANLQGIEHWVATNLDSWISINDSDTSTPAMLHNLIVAYRDVADECYSQNPEAVSVMLLTTLELWVACDKAVCAVVPLLAKYKPDIPRDVLQGFLLPQKAQMDRLRLVELYLEGRDSAPRRSSLLWSTRETEALAVQFFDQSRKHQDLGQAIVAKAHIDKAQKLEELKLLKAQYNVLKQKREIEDMEISVYEDLLPMSENRTIEAKVIVFKLDVPVAFARWRDTRAYILERVLKGKWPRASPRASYNLSSNRQLSRHFRASEARRIGLLSEDKPHIVTYRSEEPVSAATPDTLCRPTGLTYKYYGSNSDCFIAALEYTDDVPKDSSSLTYLARARNIAYRWMVSLREKAHRAIDHSQRSTFVAKSVEVALICISVFDVDDAYLAHVLASPEAVSVLVQCSITIRDGSRAIENSPGSLNALLQHRSKRLLHRRAFGSSDLLVRAQRGGKAYETVPSRLMDGAFPMHFLDDFVHWYDNKADTVEFRPKIAPWNSSLPESWTLSKPKAGGQWQLSRARSHLLSRQGQTSRHIAHILEPLANDDHIHLTTDQNGHSLAAEIPTLGLGFSLHQGSSDLQSKEHRGMQVDSKQDLGTLIGLKNKLILKHRYDGRRLVLIPESTFSYNKKEHHMNVSANKNGIVKEIIAQARQSDVFYPDSELSFPKLNHTDEFLHQRDAVKSSTFRVAGFGAEMFIATYDVRYHGADRSSGTTLAHNVYSIASLLSGNVPCLRIRPSATEHLWSLLSQEEAIFGATQAVEIAMLRYDANHLEDWRVISVKCFPSLYQLLTKRDRTPVLKYDLMMWLCTLACSERADLGLIQILALFYVSDSFTAMVPPTPDVFFPKSSRQDSRQVLQNGVSSHIRKLADSPEHSLAPKPNEKRSQYLNPQADDYIKVTDAMDAVQHWLCRIESQANTLRVQVAPSSSMPLAYPTVTARQASHVSVNDLFAGDLPTLLLSRPELKIDDTTSNIRCSSFPLESTRLLALISDLEKSAGSSKFERSYIADLQDSQKSLLTRDDSKIPVVNLIESDLSDHHTRCEKLVRELYGLLVENVAVTADLVNELRNPGHTNWDAMDYPESLLVEVESGVMIREVQEGIAAMMWQLLSNENSVMQLNMGEGKSSLIVPIVAAAMANGKTLTRVIVAKPQSKQMAEMLVSKLGSLVNWRIFYMPFSRSLKLGVGGAETVAQICQHILSFKLMAPECYISGNESVGRSLIKTQDFFDRAARDIVDESDENFSVYFELIYTMGSQRSVDMSPDRWLLVQDIFTRLRALAPSVAQDLPDSLEISPCVPGSFPRIRILKADAGPRLVLDVAQDICDSGIAGLPAHRQSQKTREDVFTYITQYDLDANQVAAVENSSIWTDTTKDTLLLLRGLLAGGVFAFVFGKRWRVNYGTATRTPPTKLAVPYRAKDNPSPRSEFSHPDVVIMLTSLCHYYIGLNNEDLFIALRHLMKSDQAEIEYQAWVEDANDLPIEFKQFLGINFKDEEQCTSVLFPALRRGKSVVDYFLAHLVFPKEMKEFPHKLSALGWDVGKSKAFPTTGFSGTCDSKALLPLSVNHLDLPSQKHTNALVLEHLLQPENSVELMPRGSKTQVTDAKRLLRVVLSLKPEVQVILDVGARVLELNNIQVAKKWLEMHQDRQKEAVVFVDKNDKLQVVDRSGRIEPWKTSSYISRPDTCLVFLDEAHTRSIDVKLLAEYRAAVTLGANLTKDRLVQACIRMRKLGKGQTVVFCVSEEIQSKILTCTGKAKGVDIGLSDVLHWAIMETWAKSSRSMPLWTVQGQRFINQEKTWQGMSHNGTTTLTKAGAEKLQELEAASIDDRYRPRPDITSNMLSELASSQDPDLQRIEEQERELSPEIEQERHVQRPEAAQPEQHALHIDVIQFVQTGVYTSTSKAYMPAFEAVMDTTAASGSSFDVCTLASGSKLLITADCARTVKKAGTSFVSDQYQRHVQWVLTSQARGSNAVNHIMIISPFEAQGLQVHLYITSFEDYVEICKFLGLSTEAAKDGWQLAADGFIVEDGSGRRGGTSGLGRSPVQFLKVFMTKVRRNGEGISKTHMGKLLEGSLFQRSDFVNVEEEA
ncbi:hypothetical protein DOTSEDRAFT_37894 [Dothistroma septosporum NZE10]|uniref:ubiquitinyl hydrolase 1 n=1 Tax=Dothistroma septosporum (strain NZE10 / CBS 128990) TaxID=675120 RepID=N1PCA0_DOTSN|nr:hypothetical protein DOTSEDRAFT_37894 [Dothistroma septosporum NZE10]